MQSTEKRPEETILSLAFAGLPMDALQGLQKLLSEEPERASIWRAIGIAAAIAGNIEASLSALQRASLLSPGDVLTKAYLGIALEAGGRSQEASVILDYEQSILRQPLFDRMPVRDLDEFNHHLLDYVLAHPTRAWQPSKKATHGGWQTGELMHDEAGIIVQLKSALLRVVDELTGTSMEGLGLPITAWAVALGRGGYQEPHVHQAGILSGVYYVQVPSDSADTGLLRFPTTLPWVKAVDRARPPHIVRPRAGDVVIFPSHFWHETNPLGSDGLRVSIAFDILRS